MRVKGGQEVMESMEGRETNGGKREGEGGVMERLRSDGRGEVKAEEKGGKKLRRKELGGWKGGLG